MKQNPIVGERIGIGICREYNAYNRTTCKNIDKGLEIQTQPGTDGFDSE